MVGAVETWNELAQHPHVVVENWDGYLDVEVTLKIARSPSPTWGSPVQSSSAQNKSPHSVWLWKPAETVGEWDRGLQ